MFSLGFGVLSKMCFFVTEKENIAALGIERWDCLGLGIGELICWLEVYLSHPQSWLFSSLLVKIQQIVFKEKGLIGYLWLEHVRANTLRTHTHSEGRERWVCIAASAVSSDLVPAWKHNLDCLKLVHKVSGYGLTVVTVNPSQRRPPSSELWHFLGYLLCKRAFW